MTSARQRILKSYPLRKENRVSTAKHSIRRVIMSLRFLKIFNMICISLPVIRDNWSFEIFKINLSLLEQNKTCCYRIHKYFLVISTSISANIFWCHRIELRIQWWVGVIYNRMPGQGEYYQYIEVETDSGNFGDDYSKDTFINENWSVWLSYIGGWLIRTHHWFK